MADVKQPQNNHVIGIDLGTTNSAVAILEGGKPMIIPNPEGGRTTPSVVAYKHGQFKVGDVAKRQMMTNPNTITSIKRHMGEKGYSVDIEGQHYSPQQISAKILVYIKNFVEKYTNQKISQAVITVPAYFDDSQRQATKDAGSIAGLNVLRIINEPTAASLAFGLNKKKNRKVVVYDLGGGTFDVSILRLGHGIFQVLSTNGDTHLGGDDFDKRVVDWILQNFKQKYKIDLTSNNMAMQRIKDAAEQAKKTVSNSNKAMINLPFIAANKKGPINLKMTLTRDKFNQLTNDLVQKTKIPLDNALKDAGLSIDDIDDILMNGGSTRIPAVQQAVAKWTHQKPDNSINPDEAVADGAAIQGGVLNGKVKNVTLLDVTPLSLGIETMGGVFTKLINRNTSIPTAKTKLFSTAADNQTKVNVHVYQGERPMVANDKLLGNFELTGIPPALKGVPQIAVSFAIDKNGIVNVSAVDKTSGKSNKITIKNTGGMSKQEIEKMRREAVANQKGDVHRQEIVKLRTKLTQLISKADSAKDQAKGLDGIDPKLMQSVSKAETAVKKVSSSDNVLRMRTLRKRLLKRVQNLMIRRFIIVSEKRQQKREQKAKIKNDV